MRVCMSVVHLRDEKSERMAGKETKVTSKLVAARELLPQLRRTPLFQHIKEQDIECLGEVELIEAPAGAGLVSVGESHLHFWVLLEETSQ